MFEEIQDDPKTKLAIAIAQGKTVDAWARQNGVPRSTAFRWAVEADVRKTVLAWRRQSLERAIGRMARRATKAADGITKLAEYAESESVRLSAWRAILSDQISVAKFSNLEHRMVEIEEELEQNRANQASRALLAWKTGGAGGRGRMAVALDRRHLSRRVLTSTNVPLRSPAECDGLSKRERQSHPRSSKLL